VLLDEVLLEKVLLEQVLLDEVLLEHVFDAAYKMEPGVNIFQLSIVTDVLNK
jgi:hypothetical protein